MVVLFAVIKGKEYKIATVSVERINNIINTLHSEFPADIEFGYSPIKNSA